MGKPLYLFKSLFVAGVAQALIACSFDGSTYVDPNAPWLDDHDYSNATHAQINLTHVVDNTLLVLSGESCGKSERDDQQLVQRIAQTIDLSIWDENAGRWIDQATVYSNGFQLRFLDKKHEIHGFGHAIDAISLGEDNKLYFEAIGALSNDGFDAPYELCLHYSILAWNAQRMSLDHNVEREANTTTNFGDDISSLKELRNHREALAMVTPQRQLALLPRGVAMWWPKPHQLLQASYALGQPSPILESHRVVSYQDAPQSLASSTSRAHDGGLSWDSSIIFKPNDKRGRYMGAEIVSILSGEEIALITPPFVLEPDDEGKDRSHGWVPRGTDFTLQSSPRSHSYMIESLPYDYAMPLLTGWSLGYGEDDHTILDLGIHIAGYRYEPPNNGALGRLHYALVSTAGNGDEELARFRHRISILGFDGLDSGGAKVTGPKSPSQQNPVVGQ